MATPGKLHMAFSALVILAFPAALQATHGASTQHHHHHSPEHCGRRGAAAAAAADGKPLRSCSKLPGNSLLQVATTLANSRGWVEAEGSGFSNSVCRGASAGDNLPSYFQLHTGTASLEACEDICLRSPSCTGVEFSSDLDGGRCEVWTRPQGIGATSPRTSSTCLVLQSSFEPMQSAGGQATGQACRGAHSNDDSPSYYLLREGIPSLSECKDQCVSSSCKGVEFNQAWGRCELWTRAEGIEATAPRSGFVCFKYDRKFIAADTFLRGSTAAPTTSSTSIEATTATKTTTRTLPPTTPAPARTTTPAPPTTTRPALTSPLAITRVTEHVFSRLEVKHLSVVNLTATTALVCSTTPIKSGCRVLDVSGATVLFHPEFTVDDTALSVKLSVDRLSPNSVIACFTTHDSGAFRSKLVCRVLSITGSIVAKGEPTQIDLGDEVVFSMTTLGLSPSSALVCYDKVVDESLVGVCRMVAVAGKQLFPGGHVDIGTGQQTGAAVNGEHGELEFGPEIVATRFSHDRALVCYRGNEAHSEQAMCTVLTLVGIAIVKGDDFVLSNGHFHSLSAVGLSPTAAMVCFKDFATRPAHSSCSLLAASGAVLSRVDRIEVFTGRTLVSRLSESAALACSSDGHHQHTTMCTTLALVGSSLVKGKDHTMQAIGKGEVFAAAGLSSTSALLCFEGEASATAKQGVCSSVELSWLGQPAAGSLPPR